MPYAPENLKAKPDVDSNTAELYFGLKNCFSRGRWHSHAAVPAWERDRKGKGDAYATETTVQGGKFVKLDETGSGRTSLVIDETPRGA